jgi:hypothetical protein
MERSRSKDPSGIGGWLLIPLLGLFFVIYEGFELFKNNAFLLFQSEMWTAFYTPGTIFHNSRWTPLILSLAFLQAAITILSAAAIVALFKKKRFVPALMVAIYVVGMALVANDYVVARYFFPLIDPDWAVSLQSQSLNKLIGALLSAAIWIPYFMQSKRVKNTFVM